MVFCPLKLHSYIRLTLSGKTSFSGQLHTVATLISTTSTGKFTKEMFQWSEIIPKFLNGRKRMFLGQLAIVNHFQNEKNMSRNFKCILMWIYMAGVEKSFIFFVWSSNDSYNLRTTKCSRICSQGSIYQYIGLCVSTVISKRPSKNWVKWNYIFSISTGKDKYTAERFKWEYALCQLCAKLHEQEYNQVIPDINFWIWNNTCIKPWN